MGVVLTGYGVGGLTHSQARAETHAHALSISLALCPECSAPGSRARWEGDEELGVLFAERGRVKRYYCCCF